MNLAGFRYVLETMHNGRWLITISSDDRTLVETFYDKALETNRKRPARITDRSTGKVLELHSGH